MLVVIATVINMMLITTALVAPLAIISAFENVRFAGWTMTFVAGISHAYVWFLLGQDTELLFLLSPALAGYEAICVMFIPLGIGEEEAAAEAANKD